MRKFFVLALCVFGLLSYSIGYGATARNASAVIVVLNDSVPYVNITFPYETVNLNIANNDSLDAVWVDVTSASNTSDRSKCFLVGPGDTLDLYDFATNGISMMRNVVYLGGDGTASPISVIATY